MNRVKILADSTCDLSEELLQRHHINIIPLYVNLGEASRRDGVDVTLNELFAYTARTKQTPKTAAASIVDYTEEFRSHIEAGMDAVYIGISSKMSSSVSNAVIASAEFPQGRVHVVDSANLSTGIGLLVMKAVEMAEAGISASQIADTLRAAAPKVRASFVIETLLYLYRGGRCNAVQAFGANALHLRPEIIVEDGAMRPDRKYRGSMVRCAAKYAEDVLAGAVNPEKRRVFITHTPCDPEIIAAVRDVVESSGMFEEIIETDAGSVIGSHCGPNTIGVLYLEQD